MRTTFFKHLAAAGIMLLILSCLDIFGQDSISRQSQMLDLKLQLLDSKLDLLDTKIKLWEAKPKELDIKLNEIDTKVNSMDFDPQSMTKKIEEMDSLMKITRVQDVPIESQPQLVAEEEPVFIAEYSSAIMLDPVRLMEGTFYLSYEKILTPALSLSIGGMATYSTSQGISNYFFSNQKFAVRDAATNEFRSYTGEVISGGGLNSVPELSTGKSSGKEESATWIICSTSDYVQENHDKREPTGACRDRYGGLGMAGKGDNTAFEYLCRRCYPRA